MNPRKGIRPTPGMDIQFPYYFCGDLAICIEYKANWTAISGPSGGQPNHF